MPVSSLAPGAVFQIAGEALAGEDVARRVVSLILDGTPPRIFVRGQCPAECPAVPAVDVRTWREETMPADTLVVTGQLAVSLVNDPRRGGQR